MLLLRKLATFSATSEELKNIYITFVRSVMENTCSVWHHSLSEENEHDMERVQKTALKIILGMQYKSYENALYLLQMKTLKERRNELTEKFAEKCLNVKQMKHLFPMQEKIHNMNTRNTETYKIQTCNTERLKNSRVVQMQYMLNRK